MAKATVVEAPSKARTKQGTSYPPTPFLAAYQRMWREPYLLDAYEPGTWVAFSGEIIVAAGAKLAEVIRAAESAGEPDPLLVPIPPDNVLG
jgi:hypothetical protein